MKKVEVYYFSGTGNSLFLAKELQKRIPEAELFSIVSLLKKDVIETKAEIVGLVFPIHLASLPIPVKDFIKKLNLSSSKYIFALASRIGTRHRAFMDIDKILKKKGKCLDLFHTGTGNLELQSCHILPA